MPNPSSFKETEPVSGQTTQELASDQASRVNIVQYLAEQEKLFTIADTMDIRQDVAKTLKWLAKDKIIPPLRVKSMSPVNPYLMLEIEAAKYCSFLKELGCPADRAYSFAKLVLDKHLQMSSQQLSELKSSILAHRVALSREALMLEAKDIKPQILIDTAFRITKFTQVKDIQQETEKLHNIITQAVIIQQQQEEQIRQADERIKQQTLEQAKLQQQVNAVRTKINALLNSVSYAQKQAMSFIQECEMLDKSDMASRLDLLPQEKDKLEKAMEAAHEASEAGQPLDSKVQDYLTIYVATLTSNILKAKEELRSEINHDAIQGRTNLIHASDLQRPDGDPLLYFSTAQAASDYYLNTVVPHYEAETSQRLETALVPHYEAETSQTLETALPETASAQPSAPVHSISELATKQQSINEKSVTINEKSETLQLLEDAVVDYLQYAVMTPVPFDPYKAMARQQVLNTEWDDVLSAAQHCTSHDTQHCTSHNAQYYTLQPQEFEALLQDILQDGQKTGFVTNEYMEAVLHQESRSILEKYTTWHQSLNCERQEQSSQEITDD